MHSKYRLVKDNDGVGASIRRHVGVLIWLVLVPLVTLFVLVFVQGFANADKLNAEQNAQTRFEATWEAGKAIPTRTP